MTLVQASLIKLIKDHAHISVNVGNFVQDIQ